MAKRVTINSEILSALREYKVNSEEAQLYLLGIYFNLNTEYISEKTRKQVNALGIVEREYRDNYKMTDIEKDFQYSSDKVCINTGIKERYDLEELL